MRRGVWKKAVAAGLALLAGAGCFSASFSLSGTITAVSRLRHRTERPNTVLFIVAANEGGVPVAVKRVINPRLPIHYQLGPQDLVLPGPAWKGPLLVSAHLNTHGQVGTVAPGDLRGRHPGPVRSGERHVDIVVDEEVRR